MATGGARFGRQIRLPEIGEDGQARLEASEVVLGGAGDAREVEAAYLRLAGVKVREAHASASAKARSRAKPDEKAAAEAVKLLGLRDRATLDVADGAMRALVVMRGILGVSGAKGDGS
jgi:hypothetical protein